MFNLCRLFFSNKTYLCIFLIHHCFFLLYMYEISEISVFCLYEALPDYALLINSTQRQITEKILQNNCIKYKINSWNPNKILMCKVNKKWNRSLDRTIMIYTIKREVMVTNKKWRTQTHNVYKRKMTYAQNRRTHKKNKKDNFTEIVCIKSEI